jgi:glycosyltransferase involved in cell wall biosynthesis
VIHKTLYLCYFGLRQPLVQTQVIPYLQEIAKDGIETHLLTFDAPSKGWTSDRIGREKQALAEKGIEWHSLTYHKRLSIIATAYDVLAGSVFVWKLLRRHKIDILHARIHVPMLMAVLARKFSGRKPKIIFDMRGFFPEEYVDGGNWKKDGALFKTVKRIEKRLLREADGFVVLTEKARDILFPESRLTGADSSGRPVEVIPCCVNIERFRCDDAREKIRSDHQLNDRLVVAYVGSLGTWYMADEMADLFKAAREKDPSVYALVLTQSEYGIMSERLRERGFTDRDFVVKEVSHSEIPEYINAADIAISFIKPCFSKLSSSPTKIAEYLAGGVPIISNSGVGDVAELLQAEKVGAVVEGFDKESYHRALDEITVLRASGRLPETCRAAAKEKFDLEQVGGSKYRSLYRKLLGKQVKTDSI